MRVYVIVLTSDKESFVKIGIAKNLTNRFSTFKRFGYSVQIKKIYKVERSNDAIKLESQLHKSNRFYKYIPRLRFAGYTECFTNVVI